MPEERAYEEFITALQYILSLKIPEIKNSQANLARSIGKAPESINAIYKRRIHRPTGKEARAATDTQEAIADYYKMTMDDFRFLGRRVIAGEQPEYKPSPEYMDEIAKPSLANTPLHELQSQYRDIRDAIFARYDEMMAENSLHHLILNTIQAGIIVVEMGTEVVLIQNRMHLEQTGMSLKGKKHQCINGETPEKCHICQCLKNGTRYLGPAPEEVKAKTVFKNISVIPPHKPKRQNCCGSWYLLP